mmetsp:Transcript_37371/g.49122  ORF Transcript_37371/g.49122 Transcript_37371/m.49122 type:complete len:176 (-) Transcript_37371:50-577(-)
MPIDLVQPNRQGGRVLKKVEVRNFVLFVTHSLRLLIIMQSVDKNCLDSDENQHQKTSLQQMLRKYAMFETAFPLSKRLVESLRGDVLWFSHSSQEGFCKLTPFYESEESKYQTCAMCDRVGMDLKVCSRCRKAYYCNQVCQKTHYSNHKKHCIVKTVEMLTGAANALTAKAAAGQ